MTETVRRLVVAQDTGGAIRGPVRGDLYWGFGAEAEHGAGGMKARGRYFLFLPKTVRHNVADFVTANLFPSQGMSPAPLRKNPYRI